MLQIILAALPMLGNLIPKGKTADIVAAGTKVAQEMFGTADEQTVLAKLESDPKLAEQFKAKLAAETEALQIESRNYELQVQDAANARASNQAVIDSGSKIAWSGPVIDTVVVVGFLGLLFLLIYRPVEMSPIQVTVINVLLGYLGASFQQIINYHRGSSAGSAIKDRVIQTISAENTSTAAKVAAKVVEAAKR